MYEAKLFFGPRKSAFNAFTGTALWGLHYRPSTIIVIVRGIAQGVPTAQLARELNLDRGPPAGPAAQAAGLGLPAAAPAAAG
jgi:hypothetical protein